jgi:glutamate racemase
MIGVFDSGVGGLTVVKEIFKHLPDYQIIYFGDTARLPYGTKGADFVKKYSEKITDWLLDKGSNIIIIACNTSSAWATEHLKKQFPKAHIFEMICPAVREALLVTKNNKIGIIGTPGTIKSQAYDKLFEHLTRHWEPQVKIFSQACPLFVPLVEEGIINEKITQNIIEKYLEPLKEKKIDTLILGCTHYPLLKEEIEKFVGPSITVINPAESLVREVKKYIQENKIQHKSGENKFYFSDEPYNLEKISHLCFNKKIIPIVNDPFI